MFFNVQNLYIDKQLSAPPRKFTSSDYYFLVKIRFLCLGSFEQFVIKINNILRIYI